MPLFPRGEADILRLAEDFVAGLIAHPDLFPAPLITPEQFNLIIASYKGAHEALIIASGQAQQATATKDQALATLVSTLKTGIRYAENVAHGEGGKLQLVGWNARRTAGTNEAPGQVGFLEVVQEGEGTVALIWTAPTVGGEVAAYKIQRRKRDSGAWADVGSSVETTATLTGQDAGIEFEYRVIAFNKVGAGVASNSVRAVL